jgi:hypothetical protein
MGDFGRGFRKLAKEGGKTVDEVEYHLFNSSLESIMYSLHMRRILSGLLVFYILAQLDRRVMAEDVAQYGQEVRGDELILMLARISKQIRHNQESIETWKGKSEYRDSKYSIKGNPTFPQNRGGADRWEEFQFADETIAQARETLQAREGHWYIKEGTAEFLLDQRNQKYRVLNQPSDADDIWDPLTGYKHRRIHVSPKSYTVFDAVRAVEFSPNRFFTTIPKPGFDNDVFPEARIAFVMTPSEAVHRTELINMFECFCVFSSVSFSGRSSLFSSFPEMVVAAIRDEGPEESQKLIKEFSRLYKTDEEPPVVTLIYGKPAANRNIYQFDGKAGYNVTRYTTIIGENRRTWRTVKYAEMNRKFVPIELRYSRISANKKFEINSAFARTVTIETESINQPIAATEFELINLGLNYGDRKYDATTGKAYAYDDQLGFIPTEEFTFDPSRRK